MTLSPSKDRFTTSEQMVADLKRDPHTPENRFWTRVVLIKITISDLIYLVLPTLQRDCNKNRTSTSIVYIKRTVLGHPFGGDFLKYVIFKDGYLNSLDCGTDFAHYINGKNLY